MERKTHRFLLFENGKLVLRAFAIPYSRERYYIWTEDSPDQYDSYSIKERIRFDDTHQDAVRTILKDYYGASLRFVFRGDVWIRLDANPRDRQFGWKQWSEMSSKQEKAANHAKFAARQARQSFEEY